VIVFDAFALPYNYVLVLKILYCMMITNRRPLTLVGDSTCVTSQAQSRVLLCLASFEPYDVTDSLARPGPRAPKANVMRAP